MSDYLDEFWTRHCTSTERGGRADHLHGQSVGSAHMRSDKKSIERCKKEMKQAMGASYGTASGVKIDLKVLVTGRTLVVGLVVALHRLDRLAQRRRIV